MNKLYKFLYITYFLFFVTFLHSEKSVKKKNVKKKPSEDKSVWFLSYSLGGKIADYPNLFYTFRAERKISRFGIQIGMSGYGYQLRTKENVLNLFTDNQLAPKYQMGFSTTDLGLTYHFWKYKNFDSLVYGGLGIGFLSYGSYVHKLYTGIELRYYIKNFYLFGNIEPRYLKIYNRQFDASILEYPVSIGLGIRL